MQDVEMAQKIVRGSFLNFSFNDNFMETSGIYKFTNEDISSFSHHLENKGKVLSVISSGNHILNSILLGAKQIDCFDISIFPQYYLYLQIASIISLSKEEYFKYYISGDRDELFSDELYDKISNNLKGKYKEFWNNLYMFNEGIDIYESLLFRQDIYNKESIVERNPYLQDNNYQKLQNILTKENIIINPSKMDIMKTKIDTKYNLILLSNILSYYFKKGEIDKYINFLKNNFNLSDKGKIINYLYSIEQEKIEKFNILLGNNGHVEDNNGKKILVYHK